VIYRLLAEKYHYTPSQIAEMPPVVQVMLLDESVDGKRMTFTTREEYEAWMRDR
jgi:hypothetical protein